MGGGRGAAVAALVALLAGGLLGAGAYRLHPLVGPRPAADNSIAAFVPTAEHFVEAHRGLAFKRPVTVGHLSDQAFQARVIALQRRDRADSDRQAKVLRALGLIPPSLDPEHAMEELLATGVIGFYDPRTAELEVRGDTATQAVRHVVVHELTHALQDQWFDINTPLNTGSGNDDAALAFTALVEGDAVRIETAYINGLSATDRQALQAQERGGSAPSDVPQSLIALLSFPYVIGPRFVTTLLAAKGQAGLDDAFKHRPAASSDVIHPDRFIAGDALGSVTAPPADGTVFDQGSLGEADLDLLLNGVVGGATIQAAVSGWAGDRYVAWPQDSGYCVRDRFALSTATATAALTSALQALAASRHGVTVEAGAQPVLTACA